MNRMRKEDRDVCIRHYLSHFSSCSQIILLHIYENNVHAQLHKQKPYNSSNQQLYKNVKCQVQSFYIFLRLTGPQVQPC